METRSYKNIFDSHTHYDDPRFNEDREQLFASFPQHGVRAVMEVGASLEDSATGIALAERFPFLFASVGIHPHDAKNAPPSMEDVMIEMIQSSPKVRAIGEIGLDYYYDNSPREIQRQVFERQLIVAKELNLPVIIHSRDAHQETFDILKKYQPKAVIHSYSGSAEMAVEYEKLGFYFGFTGVLTFKNARRALEAVEAISPDRLLIETDCPYMAPTPFRGKRSDSTMLPYVLEKMAELKKLPPQTMADITFENACRLYGIQESEV